MAAVAAVAAAAAWGSPAAGGGAGRLVVEGPGGGGVALGGPGGSPTVIGREDGCAVRFPVGENAVSRRHAEVSVDAHGSVIVVPLGVNGVKVNGKAIRRKAPHVLSHGDVLGVQFSKGTQNIVFEAAGAAGEPSPTLVIQAQRSPLGMATNALGARAAGPAGKSPARRPLGPAGKENPGAAPPPPPPPPPPPCPSARPVVRKVAPVAAAAPAARLPAAAPGPARPAGLELSVNLLQDTLKGLRRRPDAPAVRGSPAGKALRKAREAQPVNYQLELNNAIQKRMRDIKKQRAGDEVTPTKGSPAAASPVAGTPRSAGKRSAKKRPALKGATPRSGRKQRMSVKFREGLSDSPLAPAITAAPASPQGADLPHVNDTASLSQWAFASMAPAAGAQEAATPEFKSRPAACPPVVATPYGFPVAATPLAMRAPAPTPSAGGLATGGKAVAMEAIEKLAEIARLGFGLMRGAAAEEDDTGALPHIMATPSWKHAFVRELEKGNDFSPAGVAAAAVAAATPEPAAPAEDDDTEPLPHVMATPSWQHAFVRELEAAAKAALTPEPLKALLAATDDSEVDEQVANIMATPSWQHAFVKELHKAAATPQAGGAQTPVPNVLATPSWRHDWVASLNAGPSAAAATAPVAEEVETDTETEAEAEADARAARWQERKRLKAKAFVGRAKRLEAMNGHLRRKAHEASRAARKHENTSRALKKRVKVLEAMLREQDLELNEMMQRQLGNPTKVQAADACAGTTPLPCAKQPATAKTPASRRVSVSRRALKSAEKMRSQAVKSGRVVIIKQVTPSAEKEPCNVVVVCRPKQAEARCPTPQAAEEAPAASEAPALAQLSPVPMRMEEPVDAEPAAEGALAVASPNVEPEAAAELEVEPLGAAAAAPAPEAGVDVEPEVEAVEDEAEEEEEEDVCYVCGCSSEGSVLLLCDGCDKACHLKCTKPRLRRVPKGDWFCTDCKAERKAAEEAAKEQAAAAKPKAATSRAKRAAPEPAPAAASARPRRSTRARR